MQKKKSIVLSDVENTNKKAVLTLIEEENLIHGTLRLYNFIHELTGISSLGFYVDQKVYKAGLNFKSYMFYEFFLSLECIPQKFSCAVINFQNAEAKPILYGSSEGSQDDVYANIISEISSDKSIENAQNVLDKYDVNFEEDEQKEIEKEIDNAFACKENCAECVYKKYFYENSIDAESQTKIVQNKEEKEPEKHEEEKELAFFDKLKPQIDKLFSSNPIEDNLQKLIPSSKWVKVEYEDDGDFYVFGLLYDEMDNVKYVCYGVPAIFEEQVPPELSGYPIWLPLDKENDRGFGYWLTYQDASTGEPVKAIID